MNQIEYSLLAAGVVAAVLYILFGDTQRPRERKVHDEEARPAGLINLGNTCFLNSVLQALASCTHFTEWLKAPSTSSQPVSTVDSSTTRRRQCKLLLADLISGINGSDTQMSNTRLLAVLLDQIRSSGWVVEACQHDAHELYQALISLLSPNTTDPTEPMNSLEVIANCQDHHEPLNQHSIMHRTNVIPMSMGTPAAEILLPFHGLIASSMTCKTCLKKNVTKYDAFSCLSLHFPTHTPGPFSLDDLLKYYFLSETLSDVNCETCQRSAPPGYLATSDFIREVSIGKAPQCLAIHIVRLGWYGTHHEALKRQDRIVFPSVLDISPYTQIRKMMNSHNRSMRLLQPAMQTLPADRAGEHNSTNIPSTPTKPCWYRLKAVIEHLGSEHSGHFTTYRRMSYVSGSKWVYTSDLDVYDVSAEHVHTRPPYMLLYERVDSIS